MRYHWWLLAVAAVAGAVLVLCLRLSGDRRPWSLTNRRGPLDTYRNSPHHRSLEGFQGELGIGTPGRDGARGPEGQEGEPGENGRPGHAGETGPPGLDGRHRIGASTILALHSQTSSPPDCPDDSTKLWDGYSLMDGLGLYGVHNDLGRSGSCMENFSRSPFITRKSELSSRWLVAQSPGEAALSEVSGVSRCSVCDVVGSVLTLHSQTTKTPQCPPNWFSLWAGYSFLGDTSYSNLYSPGSCLRRFPRLDKMYIDCSDTGCTFESAGFEKWVWAMDSPPEGELIQRVSRCRVCSKQ